MDSYVISINNKSNTKQSYAIFVAAPIIKVKGASSVGVITRIVSSVRGVAGPQGQASFIVSKEVFAMCGIYDVESDTSPQTQQSGPSATGTVIWDYRPVVLGSRDKQEELLPGTTLRIECSDVTPAFTTEANTASGEMGSFCIQTGQDFSVKEAKCNQYVVGFTSSMRQNIGPYATFVPEPGVEYQVAPSKKFYIAVGEFNRYDFTTMALENSPSTCKVDFGSLETDQATLTHSDAGGLVVSSVPGKEGKSEASLDIPVASASVDPALPGHT